MSQGLATIEAAGVEAPEWTRERIDLIKRTYCKGASDDELALFIATCQRTGLAPEARQIFAVKRYDASAENKSAMTIQVSIDGLRLIAERSGKWAGTPEKLWCGPDGTWVDVWLSDKPPAAAKVTVLRHDWAAPASSVALWSEFAQTKKDGTYTAMWDRMPALMLAKCAEALALRSAFPAELSGLYTPDEMGQADPAIPAVAKPRPKAVDAVMAEISDPTVKLLVEDLNAIPDADARKEAKAEFVKRFGKPETLKPDQYEEAAAYVASVTF